VGFHRGPLKYSEQEAGPRRATVWHGFRKVDTVRRGREKALTCASGWTCSASRGRGPLMSPSCNTGQRPHQAVDELMCLRDELKLWLAVRDGFAFPDIRQPKFRCCPPVAGMSLTTRCSGESR